MKPLITAPAIALLLLLGAQVARAQTQPSAAPAPAPATAAADPRFDINKFTVRGATLITADGMNLLLAPYIGKNKDFGDVQKALEALEKAYTSKGYSAVLVILPEQQIDDGEVEFDVIEAKIGKIVIEGNKYFDEANIRASLPQVQQGQPPNIFQISDNLRVANENPAKQTTVLLRSGAEEGQVDAVVRVADERPNRISLTLDNSGTQQTGTFRVGLGYQNSNMWNRDHVLNAQYVTAPNDQDKTNRLGLYPSENVLIVGAQYRIPLYRQGDTLEFSAGYSNVNSGIVQNLFAISGAGTVLSARYNQNLEKIGDLEHKLSYALDWRAYQSIVTQVGVAGAGLVPDITVHPVSLMYSGNYRRSESETNFSLAASQNLPGGNDAGTGAFGGDPWTSPARPAARAGANPRYFITRWGFNHNRALPRDWQFRFGMNGQMTRDMLIAGEQFGIGGADSVRGFLEREIIGDNGYRGTMEFYTPDFGSVVPLAGVRMRALAFYDWGAVRRMRPTILEVHSQHIAGAGFGVRFSRGTNISLRLDVASVQDAGGLQKVGDVRVHASFAYIY